jgi:hypothetical protein
METNKVVIKLHPDVEKTHTPAKGVSQKMYAPKLGEFDLEHMGPDKVEQLEKLGVLVKKGK